MRFFGREQRFEYDGTVIFLYIVDTRSDRPRPNGAAVFGTDNVDVRIIEVVFGYVRIQIG